MIATNTKIMTTIKKHSVGIGRKCVLSIEITWFPYLVTAALMIGTNIKLHLAQKI